MVYAVVDTNVLVSAALAKNRGESIPLKIFLGIAQKKYIPKSSRNRLERKVPNAKHTRTYPALLIGRLGVNGQFQRSGLHLGSQVIDYLISWFIHPDNKTGCRFMVIDTYNRPETINFYQKNGFRFLYSDENLEKEAFRVDSSQSLNTRMMYLDLIDFVP